MINKLLTVGLTLFFSALTSSTLFGCELRYASPSIEPHFWKKDGQHTGIAVDFLNLVAAQSNCKISYQIKPWKRVMHEMQQGSVDITIGFYAPSRESFARYSSAKFGDYEFVIFAKTTMPKIANIVHLYSQQYKLLYLKNWFLGSLKPDILSGSELAMPIYSVTKGLQLLQANRAQALLSSKTNGLFALKRLQLNDQVQIKSPVLESFAQYIIFAKKSVTDAEYERINQAMQTVVQAAAMQKITAKYLE